MTITSLTQYQQLQSTISSTFSSIRWEFQDFSNSVGMIKEIYDLDKIQEKFKDGTVPYPLEENPLENGHCGAQIEFRCVLLNMFLFALFADSILPETSRLRTLNRRTMHLAIFPS